MGVGDHCIREVTHAGQRCHRTGVPMDDDEGERRFRVYVEDGDGGGFLSRAAAREEAPALWAMVESFYAVGLAELGDVGDVERFMARFAGAALTTAMDAMGAQGIDDTEATCV